MNGFRKWLSFSKGERVAIISILAVIMALVLANVFHHGRKSLSEASLHNLDSLLALRQHALWEQQSKMAEQTQDVAELHPFPFNPNTLTEDEWRQIGLTDRQIRNIMNYQAKGGKFYSKNDLAKLYTISEEDFAQLESFIVLPEVTRKDYKKLNSEVKDYQQVIPPPLKTIPMVDLNRVDSATLVELPQIGGYTATRIVAYREKLGGFLSKEQLLEVKGMDEARYNVVQRYINIGEAEIRKIDVNRADFKALVSHPYLNYNQVKRIVNQREKRGMIKDWEQLNALIAQDEPVNPLLEMYVAF